MRSTLIEPKVIVSAQVPREQREALEREAQAEDRTLSAVIRRAIGEYLNADRNDEMEAADYGAA